MNTEAEILPTDSRGRVWVSRERREALLEEFDRSGMSAARFAAYVGVKYPTFANWRQSRRKAAKSATSDLKVDGTVAKAKWVEAIVETRPPASQAVLSMHFPGRVRLEVTDAGSARLAVELLREWSRQSGTSC